MKQIIITLLLFMLSGGFVNSQDSAMHNSSTVDSNKVHQGNSFTYDNNESNLDQTTKPDNFWLWFVIILEGIGLVVCFAVLLNKERIKNITANSERLNQKFVSKKDFFEGKSNGDLNMFEGKIQRLERMFGDLQKRFDDYSSIVKDDFTSINKSDIKQAAVITSQATNIVSTTTQSHKEIKYLKQRNGNIFNQTSDSVDGCHFQIFEIETNSAKFKFCGKEDYAINNRNEVFDDVCVVSGTSYNAKRVLHEENGEVTLQDGKWTVTKKAKIKFI